MSVERIDHSIKGIETTGYPVEKKKSHFTKPKINFRKRPNLKLRQAFLSMTQKPEIPMEKRGKTETHKN